VKSLAACAGLVAATAVSLLPAQLGAAHDPQRRLQRPPPPAEWASRISGPRLAAGSSATFVYRASSADALRLTVSLQPLPKDLRLVRSRTTPYATFAGRPRWELRFPGRSATERRITLRIRVLPTAPVGRRLCFTLLQVASNGGVADVVPRSACARVNR
jgi:hypothetical protein